MKAGTERAARAVFDRVLKTIKPTKEELEESVYNINELTGRLKKVVPKEVVIRVVGSVVRGTQLRGESDIDIFLLFPKKYSRDKITKDGLEYAKKIVRGRNERYEIKYAEHPYARLHLDSLDVEADIVPAFNIDNIEDMGTAVDRSPMHADFINGNLTERQRDDVRLLKYLLKTQEIYGAEVMTSGFSGYLCELLVYHYGSLLDLLENASEFMLPVLLDPRTRVAMHDLTLVKRFNSMFVVIDPVDKNRNVAAGVSPEALARFVVVARKFVAKPDARFFFGKGFSDRNVGGQLGGFLETSGLDMFVIATRVPNKSEDIVWPQMRKVSEFITDRVERFGFEVYITLQTLYKNRGLLVFFAPRHTLKTRLFRGPSVFIKKAQQEFMDAHKNSVGMVLRGERIYALDRNKYESVHEIMKVVAAGGMIKRHKDIKLQGSRLLVNKVPHDYAEAIYAELQKKISL